MSVDDGGPAFPFAREEGDGSFVQCDGLSLRDYFAAKALNGLLSNSQRRPTSQEGMSGFIESTAVVAYEYADAMLKAREA